MASLVSQNTDSRIKYLPIAEIEPNPFQPRQIFDEEDMGKLVASLKQHGVLQSVLVRPYGDGFQLIAGERRWRAATTAGFKTVPAIIRDVDDATMVLLADEENENRVQITDMDRALRLKKLWESWEEQGKKPSYRSIAAFLKKDKNWVSDRLRSLGFHEDVRGLLERQENVLTISKEINAMSDRDRRARYIQVLDAGGSAGDVHELMAQDKQQDEELAAKLTAIKEAQTPPDNLTQQAVRSIQQNGYAPPLGRGSQPLLSDNYATAKAEVPLLVQRLETWAKHLPIGERRRQLAPLLALLEEKD